MNKDEDALDESNFCYINSKDVIRDDRFYA